MRHGARPVMKDNLPVHVTKRVSSDVTRLRRYELCKVLREAFVNGCRKDQFRLCQFSIQGNHIHNTTAMRRALGLEPGAPPAGHGSSAPCRTHRASAKSRQHERAFRGQ